MRVERRTLADISEIERAGKNRLHGRRPGVVSEPLDLDIWTEPFLKPPFALAGQSVGDDTLSMRDVREMPETNHGFFFPTASLQEKRKRSDNCYQYFYLHSFVFNRRCRHELWEIGIVSRRRRR